MALRGVCQKAFTSGSKYPVVTTPRPWLATAGSLSSAAIALVLELAGHGRSGCVLQQLEAVEDEAVPLAYDAARPPKELFAR
jgi:hypothetical protein